MDKKIAGLLGAAAALSTVTAAHAAAPAQADPLAPAASYRELLNPVSNPLEVLKTDDARLAQAAESQRIGGMQVAQDHHHHHHHHRVRRHHHHHHHHHQYL